MASDSAPEDPWYPKTLLSFDGGGVRGYSSLLILKALMEKISRLEKDDRPIAMSSADPLQHRTFDPLQHRFVGHISEPISAPQGRPGSSSHYLVSHYFDYIAGTSTGGLIAIMLGRFYMTIDECIEAYRDLIPKIFAKSRPLHFGNTWLPIYKYDHNVLEEAIKSIVRSRTGRSGTILKQPNEDMCRVMTLAWQKEPDAESERAPILFRSYRHPNQGHFNERNPGPPCTFPIWQVARATSAAPPYFEPIKFEPDGNPLIDGGLGANNPSNEAWRSIRQLHNNQPNAVTVLVSIGTGKRLRKRRTPVKNFYQTMYGYHKTMKDMATNTHVVHEQIQSDMTDSGHYYRLDVQKGLGDSDVPLDACKGKRGADTLELIRQMTEDYLRKELAENLLRKSAERLVAIRKARSNHSDRDRWERFCHGLEYKCPVSGCLASAERWKDRLVLQSHLEQKHPANFSADTLQSLLDTGKSYSIGESE